MENLLQYMSKTDQGSDEAAMYGNDIQAVYNHLGLPSTSKNSMMLPGQLAQANSVQD